MASSLPSSSLPRQLLRYMSSRLGTLHRSPLRVVQPKPVAVAATIAAASATAAYYHQEAAGRHGDGIAADGDAAARVASGSNVAAAGRQLLVAERSGATAEMGASGRSAELALPSMENKTPKEGKGGNGGDHNVVRCSGPAPCQEMAGEVRNTVTA
ncbi:hypothetical protein C2845_PM13G04390 [Panicum miliaceum]|uniref:Uncharacterized protein n=1 Tax=Panicum miliaceum TaxID=4540 RepID=A0A3L6RNM9_PANMI|nr:hypothetical protein C2845_PM13G04390 [Panicum miliaceum]